MKHKFAAQLSTVRKELSEDFPGVLRTLKEIGYAGVQISGLCGYEADEIAAMLQETRLGTAGIHLTYDRVVHDLPGALAEAKVLGTKDIVVKTAPKQLKHPDGYRELRANLNAVARQVQLQGYRISYHNHAFELKDTVEDQTALEYILAPTPDNQVLAEIDVYWVRKGGYDPLAFLDLYADRMPIIHLKDMTDDAEETFAEVGTGKIEFPPILAWGERNGIEWYAVEQDVCKRNPLDCLETSLRNLHRMVDEGIV